MAAKFSFQLSPSLPLTVFRCLSTVYIAHVHALCALHREDEEVSGIEVHGTHSACQLPQHNGVHVTGIRKSKNPAPGGTPTLIAERSARFIFRTLSQLECRYHHTGDSAISGLNVGELSSNVPGKVNHMPPLIYPTNLIRSMLTARNDAVFCIRPQVTPPSWKVSGDVVARAFLAHTTYRAISKAGMERDPMT